MKFFKLSEPKTVLPFALRLLENYGLRGGNRRFLQFQLTVLWTVVMIDFPKIFLGFPDHLDLVIRSLSELLFQLHIQIRIVIFAWNRSKFEEMIAIMRKVYNKLFSANGDSTLKDIVLESNTIIDRRSKGYFLYILGCVSLFSLAPVVQSVMIFVVNKSGNGTEKAEYVTMMEQEFYGLNVRGNFGHYVIYVALAGLGHYYSAVFFAIVGVVMLCGVSCSIVLFRLVIVRLNKLHELSGSELREELRDIIDLHGDALKCTQLLEKIANLAMIVQMVDCVLIWISMVLYVRDNLDVNAISVLVLLVVLTGETYALCNLLTKLTGESLAVTRAIIDCPWYGLPLDVQKALSFVIFRAQRKEGITAAKFFFMDIERFGKVAQTSYSIYVVLKDQL
ncbi:uncharacterized protein LOC135699475 [Ochlerotatus camptorhynchus]|uniref:uncharacterized protein LOC135699475 n=1 Tax=Ochlerotatus camptorhynchus TaxID=644619 RepID=UPI0031DDB049